MFPGQRLSKNDSPKVPVPSNVAEFREIIGSCNYLACWTRPDISFAVSHLSQFLANLGEAHVEAAYRLLRYLQGTKDLGIEYSANPRGQPAGAVYDVVINAVNPKSVVRSIKRNVLYGFSFY